MGLVDRAINAVLGGSTGVNYPREWKPGLQRDEVERRLPVHYGPTLAVVGLFVSLLIAFLPPLFGEPILTHTPAAGAKVIHFGSLELITAVAFDVGVFMIVLGFCVSAMDMIVHAQRAYRRRSI